MHGREGEWYRILVRKSERKRPLDIDGRIISK
jgi:hypothetical protein